MSAGNRYICIHGHFYQPPRENPWLEATEMQDSAAPYHDWNERITAQCYAPNLAARILDADGMVVGIINNYAYMSFNFGPTLLAWLARHSREVLEGLKEADRISLKEHNGHGNALAQAYNHIILPLASWQDKLTQVRWGIEHFRGVFERDPEGMWLPETAVDIPTLEALAQEGIRFTILSPEQALRCRPLGKEEWVKVNNGNLDTSHPYICPLPSGRSIVMFFYNAPISRGVAFEGLLNDGEALVQRLIKGFKGEEDSPQLVHIATDGETYGHHHRFGEMALAYALSRIKGDPTVRLTNYGEFLSITPPTWEVEIKEGSSWSCVHGVERWRADCGCSTGSHPGWHQRWRAPLREALDYLKAHLDALFEEEGEGIFRDPWEARDAYIHVLLDRNPRTIQAFWREHRNPKALEVDITKALELLEMQRNGLLMFTSCGWFFEDISGIEATKILQFAARAIQLAEGFGRRLEEGFVTRLGKAQSNLPQWKNGRVIWERAVRPAVINLKRVVAHYAIHSLFEKRKEKVLYSFEIDNLYEHVESFGTSQIALGKVEVTSRITLERMEAVFGVIHFGGLDFACFVGPSVSTSGLRALRSRLFDVYRSASLGEVYSLMKEYFPSPIYHLKDLFVEEQRRIIRIILEERFMQYCTALETLVEGDLPTLSQLGSLGYPIPEPIEVAANLYLNRRIEGIIEGLCRSDASLEELTALVRVARVWGWCPEEELWGRRLSADMARVLTRILEGDEDPEAGLNIVERIMDAAERLDIGLELFRVQGLLIKLWKERGPALKALAARVKHLAGRLGLREKVLFEEG